MRSIIRFGKKKLLALNDVINLCYKTKNIRLLRATQALIYIGSPNHNYSFSEIANILSVSRKIIYNWLTDFMIGGVKWLLNDPFH